MAFFKLPASLNTAQLTALRYVLIWFLTFFSFIASAQVADDDTVSLPQSKAIKYREKTPWKAQSLRLGLDLYPLIVTALDPDFTGATTYVGVNFSDRYWVSTDIGFQNAQRTRPRYPFYSNQTEGAFFRLGIDYNLSYWDIPSGAALCAGLHYGRSTFANTVTNPSYNAAWGGVIEQVNSPKARSSWLEPRFTLQAKVFEKISLAAILGLRIRTSLKNHDAFPNEVPGFGLLKHRAMLAFGYRICYELTWGGKTKNTDQD